jgi:hypothetical protein
VYARSFDLDESQISAVTITHDPRSSNWQWVRSMARTDELGADDGSVESRTLRSGIFDWTILVLVCASMCTVAWIGFLLWAAVRIVAIALS